MVGNFFAWNVFYMCYRTERCNLPFLPPRILIWSGSLFSPLYSHWKTLRLAVLLFFFFQRQNRSKILSNSYRVHNNHRVSPPMYLVSRVMRLQGGTWSCLLSLSADFCSHCRLVNLWSSERFCEVIPQIYFLFSIEDKGN